MSIVWQIYQFPHSSGVQCGVRTRSLRELYRTGFTIAVTIRSVNPIRSLNHSLFTSLISTVYTCMNVFIVGASPLVRDTCTFTLRSAGARLTHIAPFY